MKMSQLKMVIREVVREEIRLGLKEVIGDIKQPTNEVVSKPKPKKFSNNSVLNEVLNETQSDEWETMGGSKFTSERMNELMGGSYADMMNGNPNQPVNADAEVAAMGKNPESVSDKVKDNIFNKDYSGLMKAIDKKKQQKTGA